MGKIGVAFGGSAMGVGILTLVFSFAGWTGLVFVLGMGLASLIAANK